MLMLTGFLLGLYITFPHVFFAWTTAFTVTGFSLGEVMVFGYFMWLFNLGISWAINRIYE